jgi:glycosyltransferase involved in cell wall biosynthesis
MPPTATRKLAILGTRGLPSGHSGFESFVARLAPYLVQAGWDVQVYCQDETGNGPPAWGAVSLVQIPVSRTGSLGSIIFDAKAIWRAAGRDRLILTMGYNTAILSLLLRLRGRRQVINMDGIEWRRAKWSAPVKAWFYLNDWLGCLLGNHLVADHPDIARHLATRVSPAKISMIPYCADPVDQPDADLLAPFGVQPDRFALVICRPEPENSILEIVRAFAARPRGQTLIVLGRYTPDTNAYHRAVLEAAGPEVTFPGAIYDPATVGALRAFTRLYIHGHQVGGTNPSLVEALAAPAPVLARENIFNRWVAGDAAAYFADEADCAAKLDHLLATGADALYAARRASAARHEAAFTPAAVLGAYATLLEDMHRP